MVGLTIQRHLKFIDIFLKLWLTETGELIVSCGTAISVVVDELSNIANFFLSRSEG